MSFTYSRRIYLSDTDAAGVVFFARGFAICHEAYEEWLVQGRINLNQMIQQGEIAIPIVHAEIDFLRPMFCGDQVQIALEPQLISANEFAIAYRILSLEKATLATAQTRHVCINPRQRRRIDLPSILVEWLSKQHQPKP